MTESVGIRELRTRVSELVRRAEAGERVTVSVSGRPVAELGPIADLTWTPRDVAIEVLSHALADPGLRADLEELAGERLDDADLR